MSTDGTGRFVSEILVSTGSLDEVGSRDLCDLVSLFVRTAASGEVLRDEDFPEEALLTHAVSVYVGQVNNGGHWQFAVNTRLDPVLTDRVARGLRRIGAAEHIRIFEAAMALMPAPAGLPGVLALDEYTRRKPAGLDALDTAFYRTELQGVWDGLATMLRDSGLLRPVPSREWQARVSALIAAHPNYAERRAEADARLRAERGRDPYYVVAEALCRAAGISFQRINGISPHRGNGILLVYLSTSAGGRIMEVRGDRATLLLDENTPTSVSSDWPSGRPRQPDGLGTRMLRWFGLGPSRNP